MKNLNPLIRFPLGIIAGFFAGLMFLALMIGALKLSEWLVDHI